ncbi:MAG: dihydropteroate synthase [Acidobacteria bacterium]|nr:dihydropteroate synthase [Acidobacteriota bacterium]
MKPKGLDREFIVIGENIHTTRVLLRGGKLMAADAEGREAVRYTSAGGATRFLAIPEEVKQRQDYQEGRVKHVMVAIRAAMAGQEEGMEYLRALVQRQVNAGADVLDLNVDEVSLRLHEQVEAMRWLVGAVQPLSPVALSVDSSNLEIIRAGIEACDSRTGRPLLNSASLERIEALDLAKAHGLPVIVTAAGEKGMPQSAGERVSNASRMVDAALARGILVQDLFIDALVFPISVDGQFGLHCLEAVRRLRGQCGPEVHITGGLSNVSFGLPCRRLINEVFLNLAVDAGADSGIVDPVANDLNRVFLADKQSAPYRLAEDMLLGRDRNCKNYLRAYRKGELG